LIEEREGNKETIEKGMDGYHHNEWSSALEREREGGTSRCAGG